MDNFGVAIFVLFWLAFAIFMIAAMWKVLEKAGQPGWGILIPFYNVYLLLKVAGRPGWWLILYFIPLVNIIIELIVNIDIARNFGKGTGFGLGLFFLSFIFYPILGFGSAAYKPVKPTEVGM
jgi:uncharacterized membrane protein YhaH (DUF805 family)